MAWYGRAWRGLNTISNIQTLYQILGWLLDLVFNWRPWVAASITGVLMWAISIERPPIHVLALLVLCVFTIALGALWLLTELFGRRSTVTTEGPLHGDLRRFKRVLLWKAAQERARIGAPPGPFAAESVDELADLREEIGEREAKRGFADQVRAFQRRREVYRLVQKDGGVRDWYRGEIRQLPDAQKLVLKKKFSDLWHWYLECP